MQDNEITKKQFAFSELDCIVNDTLSEDNEDTTEEWYERLGITEEVKDGKLKGLTEEEVNRYLNYSAMRARYENLFAECEELKNFNLTLDMVMKGEEIKKREAEKNGTNK
jgi:hypothetical protein